MDPRYQPTAQTRYGIVLSSRTALDASTGSASSATSPQADRGTLSRTASGDAAPATLRICCRPLRRVCGRMKMLQPHKSIVDYHRVNHVSRGAVLCTARNAKLRSSRLKRTQRLQELKGLRRRRLGWLAQGFPARVSLLLETGNIVCRNLRYVSIEYIVCAQQHHV